MSNTNAVEIATKALTDFAIDVLASYDVPTADCHTDPEFHEVCRESAVYLCAKLRALPPVQPEAAPALVGWMEIAKFPPPDGPPGFLGAVMDGDDPDIIEWVQGPVSANGKRWNLNSGNRTTFPATHWAPLPGTVSNPALDGETK